MVGIKMTRHAVIDQNGNVVNVIEWDGAEFLPPRNHLVVQSEICDIGDTYEDRAEVFTKKSNGRRYHRSARYEAYKNGQGHME